MSIKVKIIYAADEYGVKISAVEREAFTYAIENLKQIIPPVYRIFDPNSKTWTITDWAFLRDWIDDLSGKYQVETNLDERQDEPAPAQSMASPFQTLYLLPNAPCPDCSQPLFEMYMDEKQYIKFLESLEATPTASPPGKVRTNS
jgi:hypothetical protein